jgi:hypothetical protein
MGDGVGQQVGESRGTLHSFIIAPPVQAIIAETQGLILKWDLFKAKILGLLSQRLNPALKPSAMSRVVPLFLQVTLW